MFTIVVVFSLFASQVDSAAYPVVSTSTTELNVITRNEYCLDGYFYYSGDHTCILIVEEPSTFKMAVHNCNDQKAGLVKIDSEAKNDYIAGKLNSNRIYWIGAKRERMGSSSFHDVASNRPMIYTNWKDGQPDNFLDRENCVMMYGNLRAVRARGFWNDLNCRSKLPYLCERDPEYEGTTDAVLTTTTPFYGPCEEGWAHYEDDNTCIKLYQTSELEDDYILNSYGHCGENGSYVTIKDPKKNRFVAAMLKESYNTYFIGLRRGPHEKYFSYKNNIQMGSFRPWRDDRTFSDVDGSTWCVTIDREGIWTQIPCSEERRIVGVVCEMGDRLQVEG